MASASFPVTFPSALTLVSTQTLSDVGHADSLHNKDRAEIIATQTKLGLGSSVASGTTALLGTGGTTSAWGQITNAYLSGTAAVDVSKLAPGSNGSALVTNAGTAVWGKITTDHLAGTANIAASQLANGAAWVLLAGTILAAGAPSVAFTSISGSFRHLVLTHTARLNTAGTAHQEVGIRFNSDSASNYSYQQKYSESAAYVAGDTPVTSYVAGGYMPTAGAPGSMVASGETWIFNYGGSLFKATSTRYASFKGTASGDFRVGETGGIWRSGTAITRIDLLSIVGSFDAGCRFALYGVPS